jgi:hypothetical protein
MKMVATAIPEATEIERANPVASMRLQHFILSDFSVVAPARLGSCDQ